MIEFLKEKINNSNIGNPPWDYYFLQNLDEKEYPKYLAKLFYLNTGEKLSLKWDFKSLAWVIDKKKCKTFNQKIQWIKLYGVTDLMRKCVDKVAVRDYVREKIGEEYLKPVLQIIGNCSPSTSGRGRGEGIPLAENDISTYFDQINWGKLPNAFVIKCNHGCKWQYIIKDKDMFLQNKRLIEIVKKQMTGWLEQDYSFLGGFEMQYRTSFTAERNGVQEKGIIPKILIEPLFINKEKTIKDIELYCFSNNPKIYRTIYNNQTHNISVYDEKFNNINLKFSINDNIINHPIDNVINKIRNLSVILVKDFPFVRVDWLLFENQLYFNELTFTPFSGFCDCLDLNWKIELGNLINLERLQ